MSARQHEHFALEHQHARTEPTTRWAIGLDQQLRALMGSSSGCGSDVGDGSRSRVGLADLPTAWTAVSPSDGLFQRSWVSTTYGSLAPAGRISTNEGTHETARLEQAFVQHRRAGRVLGIVAVPARELQPGVWDLLPDWQHHSRWATELARHGELWRARIQWDGSGLPADTAGLVLCLEPEDRAALMTHTGPLLEADKSPASRALPLADQLRRAIERTLADSGNHPGVLNMAILRAPVRPLLHRHASARYALA